MVDENVKARSSLSLALEPSIVKRGFGYSIVVGTCLVLINQGDVIAQGGLTTGHALKIGLTYMVPYLVSTFASVQALRHRDAQPPP